MQSSESFFNPLSTLRSRVYQHRQSTLPDHTWGDPSKYSHGARELSRPWLRFGGDEAKFVTNFPKFYMGGFFWRLLGAENDPEKDHVRQCLN